MHSASPSTVTGPALDPFTLTVVGPTHPFWVSAHESRNMRDLVLAEITKAGITTGTGSLRYSTETRCRKKRNLKKNSVYLAPASKLAQTTLVLTVTGSNPSEDIADLIVTLSKDNCSILKEHLSPPTHPPAMRSIPIRGIRGADSVNSDNSVNPVQTQDSPDDDTLALFLDAVRDAGSTITKATAESLARKLTGDTTLVTAALQAEYIAPTNTVADLYSITIAGDALLRQIIDKSDDATKPTLAPAPSQFEVLKGSLLAARARHEKLKHDHDTHKARRSQLANDHRHADTLLQEARGALARVQEQVALAEQAHTQARQRVLTIEEQQRALPPEATSELIQAERTLKEAETAYQQLIAL
jgi:hypothetical protein